MKQAGATEEMKKRERQQWKKVHSSCFALSLLLHRPLLFLSRLLQAPPSSTSHASSRRLPLPRRPHDRCRHHPGTRIAAARCLESAARTASNRKESHLEVFFFFFFFFLKKTKFKKKKKKQRRPSSVAARAAPRPSASAQANDAVVGDIVRAARSKVGVVSEPPVV